MRPRLLEKLRRRGRRQTAVLSCRRLNQLRLNVLTTLTYDAYFDGAAAVAGAGLNGKRLVAVFGRSAEREWLKLPVPCEWSA